MAGPWDKYAGESSGLTAETADQEYERKVRELKEQYGKNTEGVSVLTPTGKDTTKVEAFGQEFDIPTFFTSPAGAGAAVGGAALAGLGAAQLLKKGAEVSKKAYNSIADRMLNKPVEIDRTVDVPMEKSAAPSVTEKPPVSPLKPAELEMIERSGQAAVEKEKEATIKRLTQEAAVPGAVAPAVAPAPVAPAVPAPVPAATTMVEGQPVQGQPIEPAKPVEPTKNKGGRPTKAAKEAEIKAGVFKEGFGGADNWLQSQVGHDIRKFIKDEFNAGKPYGGGQAAMDKAYADVTKYEQWLKENIPVQTLNKAERKAVGVPSPEPHGPLGKAMKVGGVAGLLMTAVNAANAKQAAQNVGEALLPIGMTPSELAPGTLTEKQLRAYQEAQKLGSPYRSVPPPR